jgi:hypothetical protein
MKAIVSFFAYTEPSFHIELHKEERPENSLGTYGIAYQQLTPGGPLQGYVHEDLEVTKPSPGDWLTVKLSFVVHESHKPCYERSIRITKDIEVNLEDVRNMALAPIITPEYCIAMGMYVPNGAVSSDLPKTIQIYVAVTRNYENWMGDLFKKIGTDRTRFSQLILPGSHDSGMYGTRFPVQINNVANTQKDNIATQLRLGARFFDFRPGTISPEFLALLRHLKDTSALIDYLNGFSKTSKGQLLEFALMIVAQKEIKGIIDTVQFVANHAVAEAVKLAIRDFLLRFESAATEDHHIHAAIPGDSMTNFIHEIGAFLETHPQEIVTIKISRAGILDKIRLPKVDVHPFYIDGKRIDGEELEIVQVKDNAKIFAEIRSVMVKLGINVADKTLLNTPLKKLLGNNVRLFVLFQDEMDVLSSYSDDYLSCDANKIIAGIEKTVKDIDNGENQKKNLIDLQLQLTPSGNSDALKSGLAVIDNVNATTSPLMGTKPRTDFATYPLIYDLVPGYANRQGLVTFINDYYDNGLTAQVFQANLRAAKMRGIEVE